LPREEALKLGAMALFGEKYGENVRVVTMDPSFSIELCGGTHVRYTGELGYFRIISESAVAAGVRRVEALSGQAAYEFSVQESQSLKKVKDILKNPKDLDKALSSLVDENADLRKKIEIAEHKELTVLSNEFAASAERINGISFVNARLSPSNPDALKKVAYELQKKFDKFIAVIIATIGGKPFVAISLSDAVVAENGLDAGKIIKQIVAPIIKGGGGGQKNLATAGGTDASSIDTIAPAIRKLIES
ncbi:MAG TPA: DHHA1 domain-containing protein, partial [Flavitalea sp.]|nr:DHHA1 domain-containing protein [Flavitalea sp.]